jgi:TRAP-type C4-dicarboxylate transport system permease large subunit
MSGTLRHPFEAEGAARLIHRLAGRRAEGRVNVLALREADAAAQSHQRLRHLEAGCGDLDYRYAGVGDREVAMLHECRAEELTTAAVGKAMASATRTSAMIMTILLGAHVLGYALALTQTTQHFVNAIAGIDANRYVLISLIILLKLVLGFFLDQFAILILTVPIMVPLVIRLGFDPIWFGVVLVLTAEVGMATSPVGMNAFVIARYTGRPVEEIFGRVLSHVVAHPIAIVAFTVFPQLILWLPSTMQ